MATIMIIIMDSLEKAGVTAVIISILIEVIIIGIEVLIIIFVIMIPMARWCLKFTERQTTSKTALTTYISNPCASLST